MSTIIKKMYQQFWYQLKISQWKSYRNLYKVILVIEEIGTAIKKNI